MKAQESANKSTADKIIEAATGLFALKGFAAVSVKELANAAGVNVALISYHFGGKENLYSLILQRQFEPILKFLDELAITDISPLEKIRRFGEWFATTKECSIYGERLIHGEMNNPTSCFEKVVIKNISRFHSFLCNCIKEAIKQGQVRANIDPDYASIALMNIIRFHYIARHYSKGILPARDDHAASYSFQALDIYMNGVLSPSDSCS